MFPSEFEAYVPKKYDYENSWNTELETLYKEWCFEEVRLVEDKDLKETWLRTWKVYEQVKILPVETPNYVIKEQYLLLRKYKRYIHFWKSREIWTSEDTSYSLFSKIEGSTVALLFLQLKLKAGSRVSLKLWLSTSKC